MKAKLFKLVVIPIITRIGTVGTAILLSKGLPQEAVEQIMTGLTAALMLGWDYASSYVASKRK